MDERLTEESDFPADLCCVEGGLSRVDRMDPEDQAKVIEMLEGRAGEADQAELRARFYDFAGIAAGRRVVEVGCGTGVDTRAMAARVGTGGSVLGIDPSEVLVLEARRRTRPELPARYQKASGEKIPLSPDSVDRSVAVTALSHIPDPRPVVREMVRVTRPGGRVALFDHDMGTFVVDAADREATRRIFGRYSRQVSGMDAGRRLFGLLREAGIRGVQVLAMPLVDTKFSDYFRFVVDRYPNRAVEDGALAPEQAETWKRDVKARAAAGRFFGCVVYFAAVGVK